jgi:hypothetical protein
LSLEPTFGKLVRFGRTWRLGEVEWDYVARTKRDTWSPLSVKHGPCVCVCVCVGVS